MNSIAKTSVALFAGLLAVAPAVAGDNSGVISAVLEPQYWVMALSTIALVGLGIGKGLPEQNPGRTASSRSSSDAFSASLA